MFKTVKVRGQTGLGRHLKAYKHFRVIINHGMMLDIYGRRVSCEQPIYKVREVYNRQFKLHVYGKRQIQVENFSK